MVPVPLPAPGPDEITLEDGRTVRTLVLRCASCARGYHGPANCDRETGAGPCRCLQCHRGKMTATAEHLASSTNSTGMIRAALWDMIALLQQRDEIAKAIRQADPVPFGYCKGGCGTPISGSAHGRPREWCSEACRKRSERRAKAGRPSGGPVAPAPRDGQQGRRQASRRVAGASGEGN